MQIIPHVLLNISDVALKGYYLLPKNEKESKNKNSKLIWRTYYFSFKKKKENIYAQAWQGFSNLNLELFGVTILRTQDCQHPQVLNH